MTKEKEGERGGEKYEGTGTLSVLSPPSDASESWDGVIVEELDK